MGILVVCGDSNQVLLPFLDKSPYTPPRSPTKISLSQLLSKHKLVDSWRECNPTKRKYTYYSYPHQTFTRIDHIFLTIGMIPELLTSHIIPIPWSDHNAVLTTITSTIPKKHDPTWYLPDILLKHPSHSLICWHIFGFSVKLFNFCIGDKTFVLPKFDLSVLINSLWRGVISVIYLSLASDNSKLPYMADLWKRDPDQLEWVGIETSFGHTKACVTQPW